MSSEVYKVSPLIGQTTVSVDDFNRLVTELNKVLSEIAVAQARVTGQADAEPEFDNDLNLKGHEIRNVGKITFSSRKHAKESSAYTGEYAIDELAAGSATFLQLIDDFNNNVHPDIEEAIADLGKRLKQVFDAIGI